MRQTDDDWVSVREAARMLGASYSAVYRRVREGTVPSERQSNGAIMIARASLDVIKIHPKTARNRKAIMLRPLMDRFQTWVTAAGDRSVSTWLGELADRAAGYVK